MAELDRDYLLEQLARLGDEDDAVVLSAARAAHHHVVDAGFDWDDVLEPDYDEDEVDDEADDAPEEDADAGDETALEDDDADADPTLEIAQGNARDDAALISRLLSHDAVTEDTREDLAEMQADLKAGKLSVLDQRFIYALARRLNVK